MPVTCGSRPAGPPSAAATAPLPPADRGRLAAAWDSDAALFRGLRRAARPGTRFSTWLFAPCPRLGSQALVVAGAEILPGFLSRSSLL